AKLGTFANVGVITNMYNYPNFVGDNTNAGFNDNPAGMSVRAQSRTFNERSHISLDFARHDFGVRINISVICGYVS
ncbi:MAG: hypothetical protein Q8M29_07370, partial [Bacteroidota bacterium]|nr:hypothetical protein [Bacteroidota bacterium]